MDNCKDSGGDSKQYCYILFSSVSQVIQAEKSLSNLKDLFRIVPIPRSVSSDCGMCLLCEPENSDLILRTLNDSGMVYSKIHLLPENNQVFFKKLFPSK